MCCYITLSVQKAQHHPICGWLPIVIQRRCITHVHELPCLIHLYWSPSHPGLLSDHKAKGSGDEGGLTMTSVILPWN